jgi:hypothetical protein
MKASKKNALASPGGSDGAVPPGASNWPKVDVPPPAAPGEPAWAPLLRQQAERAVRQSTNLSDQAPNTEGGQPSTLPRRDARGRLLPGSSGNLRGRPIKKGRAFTIRQMWRDFAKESAREVVVNGEKMPAFWVIWRRLYALAIGGDVQAMKLLLNKGEQILRGLGTLSLKSQEDLEMAERFADNGSKDRSFEIALNKLRKRSFDI